MPLPLRDLGAPIVEDGLSPTARIFVLAAGGIGAWGLLILTLSALL